MTVNKSVTLENVTTHNKIKKLHYTVIQLVLLKKLLTRVSLLWRYLSFIYQQGMPSPRDSYTLLKWVCHLLAVWPWDYLRSLNLSLFICELDFIITIFWGGGFQAFWQ